MTRPGGSTSRGLRYPGSDLTVDQIPNAIHDLADDIDRQLGTASGVAIQKMVTSVQLDASTGHASITFAELSTVVGCVVNWAQDNFGPGIIIRAKAGNVVTISAPLTVPYISPPVASPNPGPPDTSVYSVQYVKNRTVNVSAIAWGVKA